ncbi:hypothetical protein NM688_g9062 [Phlebia brevispora]|uniref:Uncharacterized protein n=1 Tax=Phlebia brevispora TaxID=194682 RepID=A0ACC1RMG2_9APHY|nr:hypothetical protein NM688_g9062 [Phlebia brevispora]
MSLGDADAKFPGQAPDAIPPSPSRENPGQVYPKSDPKAAPPESIPGTGGGHQPKTIVGNPFALEESFVKLDQALSEIISTIEGEEKSMGAASNEQAVIQKLKGWQMELKYMRAGNWQKQGQGNGTPQAGGLFVD